MNCCLGAVALNHVHCALFEQHAWPGQTVTKVAAPVVREARKSEIPTRRASPRANHFVESPHQCSSMCVIRSRCLSSSAEGFAVRKQETPPHNQAAVLS